MGSTNFRIIWGPIPWIESRTRARLTLGGCVGGGDGGAGAGAVRRPELRRRPRLLHDPHQPDHQLLVVLDQRLLLLLERRHLNVEHKMCNFCPELLKEDVCYFPLQTELAAVPRVDLSAVSTRVCASSLPTLRNGFRVLRHKRLSPMLDALAVRHIGRQYQKATQTRCRDDSV